MSAQSPFPNGLSADSVEPLEDSLAIRDMRARMDSIHRYGHRPTVALVLSGGGAKGAAHVGAIKYLEEQGIPVDVVLGTSIGGLIAGMYSMGYSSDEMISILRAQDWGVTLTDRVDPRYIPYTTKLYKEKYVLPIPFHYEDQTFEERVASNRKKYRARRARADMTDNAELATQTSVNSFSSSLPSGFVYGFNVNNLFSSLTVGYQDDQEFYKFPIPMYVVASDMVSCKAKYWVDGSVTQAMRSTMSIPGLFDPVRTEGMVLVDGGTRNNFPTDLAKAMGADYIIGVDLSNTKPGVGDVNNFADIFMQFIRMLGADSFNRNVTNPDVVIKPCVDGFNMLSFSEESINTLYDNGYAAAKEQAEGIADIKAHMKDAVPYITGKKAINIAHEKVLLGGVEFKGIPEKESLMLMKIIGLKVGTRVGKKEIDAAMSHLQASGAFDTITYSLYGKEEPFRLVFHCAPAPTNQFGLGFRLDTEQWAALALNVGLNAHKLMGHKLNFDLRLGQCLEGNVHYMVDYPGWPTFNAKVESFRYGFGLRFDASAPMPQEYQGFKGSLYLSKMRWTNTDLQIGARFHSYADMDRFHSDKYLGAFANIITYTLDDRYFPRTGVDFKYGATLDFKRIGFSEVFRPVGSFHVDFRFPIPAGPFAIVPDIHYRSFFDPNEENGGASVMYEPFSNFVGGCMYGRYMEQQIPFVGWNDVALMDNHVLVANLGLRLDVLKPMFFSVNGGYLRTSNKIASIFTPQSSFDDTTYARQYFGAALEVGYDTVIGPVRGTLRWSDYTSKLQFGLSIGFDF